MRDALRAQRDSGDETDQWMVLIGASLALHGLVESDLALDVHQGIQEGPWAKNSMAQVVSVVLPEVLDAPPVSETPDLDMLVDRAIVLIDVALETPDLLPA